MIRSIVGFHRDGEGDWVAEVSCWHNQHVRHRPPFEERSWVLEEASRSSHLESPIDCPLCERAELPDGVVVVEQVGPFDESSLPRALRTSHRAPGGLWGCLYIESGTAAFQFRPDETPPGPLIELQAGSNQPIPPGLSHRVIVTGPVTLRLELLGPKTGEP